MKTILNIKVQALGYVKKNIINFCKNKMGTWQLSKNNGFGPHYRAATGHGFASRKTNKTFPRNATQIVVNTISDFFDFWKYVFFFLFWKKNESATKSVSSHFLKKMLSEMLLRNFDSQIVVYIVGN